MYYFDENVKCISLKGTEKGMALIRRKASLDTIRNKMTMEGSSFTGPDR
jgi:hypothetical protein